MKVTIRILIIVLALASTVDGVAFRHIYEKETEIELSEIGEEKLHQTASVSAKRGLIADRHRHQEIAHFWCPTPLISVQKTTPRRLIQPHLMCFRL